MGDAPVVEEQKQQDYGIPETSVGQQLDIASALRNPSTLFARSPLASSSILPDVFIFFHHGDVSEVNVVNMIHPLF